MPAAAITRQGIRVERIGFFESVANGHRCVFSRTVGLWPIMRLSILGIRIVSRVLFAALRGASVAILDPGKKTPSSGFLEPCGRLLLPNMKTGSESAR